jgi:murein DD-endopeptidase MepM/ murein hydrolase activator NlpD
VLVIGLCALVGGGALALGTADRGSGPAPSAAPAPEQVAATLAPVTEDAFLCVDVLHPRAGEAPASLLSRAGLESGIVHDLLTALGELVNLRAVQQRDEFRLFVDHNGGVARLEYQRHPERSYSVEPGTGGYVAARHDAEIQVDARRFTGTVEASLYQAVLEAGGDDAMVENFAGLFQWTFDFATDTRTGDTFEILVEERSVGGTTIGFGRLLAAKYRPHGADMPLSAYFYAAAGTDGGYYNAAGESIKRRFLKSPLNYSRISSHFTHRRMHPILKKVRPHLGVDYAAPSGTPVVALGSGKVVYAGWIRGFGNTVKVQHGKTYVTQYAHLKGYAKGIRKGVRVDQNQIIGYVGSTGMATGPHLDFRVQENGAWINPLRLKGGVSEPLPAAEREAFLAVVAGRERELAVARGVFADAVPGAGPVLDTSHGD